MNGSRRLYVNFVLLIVSATGWVNSLSRLFIYYSTS